MLFRSRRPLNRVQDLVAPIYSGADLLLPRERNRILDVANDAPVYKVQFGREVELNRHAVINRGQNQKFHANAVREIAKILPDPPASDHAEFRWDGDLYAETCVHQPRYSVTPLNGRRLRANRNFQSLTGKNQVRVTDD